MRKALLLSSLFCLLPFASLAAELDRIVATINNDAVTSVQLDKALAAQEGTPSAETRRQVLDRLIEESLMRQRAAELGLAVSDDEIEAALQDVMRQNRLTREQLEAAIKQQGIAFDDYRQTLRKQILRFKLVGREVQGRIEVSSREIQEYYAANADRWREAPSIELQRITFPAGANAASEEALKALRRGTAFDPVLAAAIKAGAEGGEMGTLALEDLTPAFAAAVKDLPVGGSSEPIVTDQAIHLLVVSARTPGKVRPLDEVREEIREKLSEQKRSTAAKDWLEGLKKKAHIDVRL